MLCTLFFESDFRLLSGIVQYSQENLVRINVHVLHDAKINDIKIRGELSSKIEIIFCNGYHLILVYRTSSKGFFSRFLSFFLQIKWRLKFYSVCLSVCLTLFFRPSIMIWTDYCFFYKNKLFDGTKS